MQSNTTWKRSLLDLDVPVLAYDVLKVDFSQLEPPNDLPTIRKKNSSYEEFYEQYKPHIISEVIASIKSSRRKLKDKAYLSVSLGCNDHVEYIDEDKVTVLMLPGENRIDCIEQAGSPRFIVAECFIRGETFLSLIDVFYTKSRVIIPGDQVDCLSHGLSIKPITSLVSQNRMFALCHDQPKSPLIKAIMEARTENWSSFTETPFNETTLNPIQRQVALGFTSAKEGLYML